ncbi:hypothetical protein I0C86_11655 [Plantactinospora sp. S1510]|uniref:Uncharacterized protein n=1 Tax=Plantactinospora alkalitolerans TaxID=2789879 RepID=A0ABS0GTU7_9ACTN|nr:hypothetical protein [Plantactinospora alkalitolerans]MBF9129613.1 hypothetical protein [Plantactinospora alkalitolerans]
MNIDEDGRLSIVCQYSPASFSATAVFFNCSVDDVHRPAVRTGSSSVTRIDSSAARTGSADHRR